MENLKNNLAKCNFQKLLSIGEAADILGVKVETIYSWVHTKQIPYYKIGRLLKFKWRELEEWIQSKRVEVLDLN